MARADQALALLRVLAAELPYQLWLELRTFGRDRGPVLRRWFPIRQLQAAAQWSIAQADCGRDVYAAVQPRRTREGGAAAVGAIVALYADLDCGPNKRIATKQDAIARLYRLATLGLAPSLLVDSGHGFHAYWPLREPLEPTEQGAWRAVMRALASTLDADPTVTDLPRILRVPGTTNWKHPDDPKPVTLEHVDVDRRFTLLDFDALPPAIAPTAEPKSVNVPVIVAGSRVLAAIRAAGWQVREKRDASGTLVALIIDEPCPFCPGRPEQAAAPRRGTAHVAPGSGAFRCKRALCAAGVQATGQTADGEARGLPLRQWSARFAPAAITSTLDAPGGPPFVLPTLPRLPVLSRSLR